MAHRIPTPRAVAVLGEFRGAAVERVDRPGEFFGLRPSGLLCSDPAGRVLFVLHPGDSAGDPVLGSRAMQAIDRREQFSERPARVARQFVRPFSDLAELGGFVVSIRYLLRRGATRPVEWEHYFAGPKGPAFPGCFSVGADQWVIGPGAFLAGPGGIDYRRPR